MYAFAASGCVSTSFLPARPLRSVCSHGHYSSPVRRPSLPVMSRSTLPTDEKPATDLGRPATAKDFAKLYGGSYLGTSIAMGIVSYSLWYFLIQAGVDVVALVQSLGDWLATTPVGRPAVLSRIDETVGTAALAYIAHKASSPLRFPLTIAATPIVARAFSKKKKVDEEAESDRPMSG